MAKVNEANVDEFVHVVVHAVRFEIERGYEVRSVEIAIAEEYSENLPSSRVVDRPLHREIVIER